MKALLKEMPKEKKLNDTQLRILQAKRALTSLSQFSNDSQAYTKHELFLLDGKYLIDYCIENKIEYRVDRWNSVFAKELICKNITLELNGL